MVEAAIRTHELVRHFGAVRAVDGLTMEAPAGSIFGFLGPNGSGKTTTIRLILGLLQPTAGHVQVLGLDTRTCSAEIRERAGVVLDHHGLYEQMSAYDNLEFWARAWRFAANERAARIRDLLEHFELWERRSDRVAQWSHGMKKRLALARAFLSGPDILVLDEPTSGLDASSATALRRDLTALAKESGATVFLSTHNMAEAEQLCSEVAVIRAGRLVAVGNPDRLRAQAGRSHVEVLGRDLTPELLGRIQSRPFVASATLHNGKLSVELQGTSDPAPLVTLLVNGGASIEEVRRGAASLEEVFLSLMEETEDEIEDWEATGDEEGEGADV